MKKDIRFGEALRLHSEGNKDATLCLYNMFGHLIAKYSKPDEAKMINDELKSIQVINFFLVLDKFSLDRL